MPQGILLMYDYYCMWKIVMLFDDKSIQFLGCAIKLMYIYTNLKGAELLHTATSNTREKKNSGTGGDEKLIIEFRCL